MVGVSVCVCVRACVFPYFSFNTSTPEPFTHFLYEWLAASCLSLPIPVESTRIHAFCSYFGCLLFSTVSFVWVLALCACAFAWLFSFFYSLAAFALLTFRRGKL